MFDYIFVVALEDQIAKLGQPIGLQYQIPIIKSPILLITSPIGTAIPCYISNSPDSLLTDNAVLILEQPHKQRNSALVDDGLGLDGGARGDVGQSPGGF